MDTLITTILTSTVVSTIFLALSNIFIDQRKRSVEYITNERAKWRNDIRRISGEIMEADETNLYKPLTELKVRINAYDKYCGNKRIKNDTLIWRCIENCEENCGDIELLNIYKKNLVLYLSLMLKYDWDRSKKEVEIDKNKVLKYVFFACQVIIFSVIMLSTKKGIYYSIPLFQGYILFNVSSYMLLEMNKKIQNISKFYYIWGEWIIHVLTAILIAFLTIFIFNKIDIEISGKILKDKGFKTLFSIMALLPTQVIMLFNLIESSFSLYQVQYYMSIAKQSQNMYEEVNRLLEGRKKNKKKGKKKNTK